MLEGFLAPRVVFVKVLAEFSEDGFLIPRTMEWDSTYRIDQVTTTQYLSQEECQRLFPGPPRRAEYIIYKYGIKINGRDKTIYFDKWPESGCQSLGRWFVLTKESQEEAPRQ